MSTLTRVLKIFGMQQMKEAYTEHKTTQLIEHKFSDTDIIGADWKDGEIRLWLTGQCDYVKLSKTDIEKLKEVV